MITVVADKTIVGVGDTAEISGGGLQMGSTTRPGNNVIVRNLTFTNASDDSISVTNSAHHIWIDHNEFVSPVDGAVDIVRGAEYVTDSGPGRLVERNNIYVNSGTPETAGSVTEPRTYYSYAVDSPAGVPAAVRAGVGLGKV